MKLIGMKSKTIKGDKDPENRTVIPQFPNDDSNKVNK